MAVVAFAGRGVLRCPLTREPRRGGRRPSLAPARARPAGRDRPRRGARRGARRLRRPRPRRGPSVVVFSDGEDHAGTWQTAAERLRARGVVVHAVAVGDDGAGHPVPVGRGHEPPSRCDIRGGRPVAAVGRVARGGRAGDGGAFVPLGLATADLGDCIGGRIEPGRAGRQACEGRHRNAASGSRCSCSWRWDRPGGVLAATAGVARADRGRRSAVVGLCRGDAARGD